MPDSILCDHCNNDIPHPSERCPHCARPGIFWNVISADRADERTALEQRYNFAKVDALSRGAEEGLRSFEYAASSSTVVIARSESELLRLATSDRQLYATYYQQLEGGLRLPDGDDWDVVREIADTLLFPKYKQDIRFGALSLDGVGLTNYGSCSITLRDDMISHRTTVFEENSVVFMKRFGIKASNPELPKGYRATWRDRGKLCVAKLASTINATTTANEYSSLLLKQGASSADDQFVEVHIWGPISILTMQRVTLTSKEIENENRTIIKALRALPSKLFDLRVSTAREKNQTIIEALRSKLAEYGVPMD